MTETPETPESKAYKVRTAAIEIDAAMTEVAKRMEVPEKALVSFKEAVAVSIVASFYHCGVDCFKPVGDFIGGFLKIAHTADIEYPKPEIAWVFIEVMRQAWKQYAKLSGLRNLDFRLVAIETLCRALVGEETELAKGLLDKATEELKKVLESAEEKDKKLVSEGCDLKEALKVRRSMLHVRADEVWNDGREAAALLHLTPHNGSNSVN